MSKSSTMFLKFVVLVLALAVLAVCVLVLPALWQGVEGDQMFADWVRGIIIGMYVSGIPFYFALYQSFRLLNLIDKDQAFSDHAVHALRMIKFSALAISGVYIATMPFFFMIGEYDDAPGVIAIGIAVIFASFVVAVFAYVLQKLLRSAIDIKTENDLTV